MYCEGTPPLRSAPNSRGRTSFTYSMKEVVVTDPSPWQMRIVAGAASSTGPATAGATGTTTAATIAARGSTLRIQGRGTWVSAWACRSPVGAEGQT